MIYATSEGKTSEVRTVIRLKHYFDNKQTRSSIHRRLLPLLRNKLEGRFRGGFLDPCDSYGIVLLAGLDIRCVRLPQDGNLRWSEVSSGLWGG